MLASRAIHREVSLSPARSEADLSLHPSGSAVPELGGTVAPEERCKEGMCACGGVRSVRYSYDVVPRILMPMKRRR